MPDPILIVGAGPTGLTAAIELARRGVPHRLIDRSSGTTSRAGSALFQTQTLEYFARVDVVEAMLQGGNRCTGIATYYDGAPSLRTNAFLVSLELREAERLLEGALNRFEGRVERCVELVGYEADAIGITARLLPVGESPQTARFAYLIGCDGANSFVRRLARFGYDGEPEGQAFVVANVRLRESAYPNDEIAIFRHKRNATLLAPLPRGWWRMIATTDRSGEGALSLESLQERFRASGAKAAIADAVSLEQFTITRRQPRERMRDRVFVCGASAHTYSPLGLLPVNSGVLDAANLGWKLACVHRGYGDRALLESYQRERHDVEDRTLEQTAAAR